MWDSFENKFDKTDGCWIWKGRLDRNGYGRLSGYWAHRVSYQINVGDIPDGYQLDHLCRVRSCVNPSHMEVVTPSVNTTRALSVRVNCPSGHPYIPDNTWRDKYGHRHCRQCNRDNQKRLRTRSAGGVS